MENIILVIVLLGILGGAAIYIIRAKKKGVKCIGCPAGATCSGGCSGNCEDCSGGCSQETDQNE